MLGLVIGSIRSLVLERGKKKLGSRMLEKKREAQLQQLLKTDKAKKLEPVMSKQHAEDVGFSERQRREEEFNFMRKIQAQTSARQKWNALLASGSAWLFLWFIGALVFYFAEHEQGWSYFESLYFAYTTLLTIGYGDFKPFSNSGKAFFVLWSLLAVPTLTILISNMGDTVVKGIRDLTLWLGEFTILPGDARARQRLKIFVTRVTKGKVLRGATAADKSPESVASGKDEDPEKGKNSGSHAAATDALASRVEKEELEEAGKARDQGDSIGADIHEYHYLLIKEFRNVLKHINESPPRKYTYDEWAWFLKLMGEDEANHKSHRAPPVNPENLPSKKAPDTQQAQTDDENGTVRQWSWLGNRSPLMGEIEEAEWVLERLSMTLEKELKKKHEANNKEGMQNDHSAEPVDSSSGSEKTLNRT